MLVSDVLKLATASIALLRTSISSVGLLAAARSACRMRSPSRVSSLPFCAITAKFFSDMAADARTSAHVSFSSSLDQRTDHRAVLRLPQALGRHLSYRIVIVRQARLEHRVEVVLDVVVCQLDELSNDLAPAFGRQPGPDALEFRQTLDRQVGKAAGDPNTSRAFRGRSDRLGGLGASRRCESPAGNGS